MTLKEKLVKEFTAGISAIYGDLADKEYNAENIEREDIISIAKKVCFYLDK